MNNLHFFVYQLSRWSGILQKCPTNILSPRTDRWNDENKITHLNKNKKKKKWKIIQIEIYIRIETFHTDVLLFRSRKERANKR